MSVKNASQIMCFNSKTEEQKKMSVWNLLEMKIVWQQTPIRHAYTVMMDIHLIMMGNVR